MTSIRSEECLARSGARVAEFVHLLSVLDLQIRYDFCPILVLSHPMPIPSTILISPHSVLCVSIENGKFLAHTPILHPQTTLSSQSLSISISLKSSTLCVRCSSGRRARYLRRWRWWHSGVLDARPCTSIAITFVTGGVLARSMCSFGCSDRCISNGLPCPFIAPSPLIPTPTH